MSATISAAAAAPRRSRNEVGDGGRRRAILRFPEAALTLEATLQRAQSLLHFRRELVDGSANVERRDHVRRCLAVALEESLFCRLPLRSLARRQVPDPSGLWQVAHAEIDSTELIQRPLVSRGDSKHADQPIARLPQPAGF